MSIVAVFEHPITVRPEDIDEQGHANNVVYVQWLQDAAVGHSTANGWDGGRYRQLGRSWVVRSHAIEYLRAARLGDELVVRTWVIDMRRVTSTRRYLINRPADGAVIATAETRWAFIDLATEQPCRVPSEVAEAFLLVAE